MSGHKKLEVDMSARLDISFEHAVSTSVEELPLAQGSCRQRWLRGRTRHRDCATDTVLESLFEDFERPSKLCRSSCEYNLRYLRFVFKRCWLSVTFTSLVLEVLGIHEIPNPKYFRSGT